jgi:predicted MFS family arabinose efflux permease
VTLRDRLRDGLIMLAVAAVSFALLVYVGWGEGKRTYPRFQVEKMVAQGELVQAALETYLRAGLPLAQFPGFRSIAEPIRQSDPTIAAIATRDRAGHTVFITGETGVPQLPASSQPGGTAPARYTVRDDGVWLQVALPLRNRFETVGELTVAMPRSAIARVTDAHLPALAALAAGMALLFGIFSLWAAPRLRGHRMPWIGIGYTAVFALVAATVVASLLSLYADGAQSKAKALADSLAERIRPVVAYGLTLQDLEGLDRMLAAYRQLNPDIQAVGITQNGRVLIHSDPAQVGQGWISDASAYDYVVPIPATATASDIRIAVALPAGVVWRAVAHSVKNFAALFVATALIAALFLGVARALESNGTERKPQQLALIRPIFFIAIFCEYLSAGFLPQLLRGAAVQSGLGQGAASLAFTAYFVAFLLVLLPVSAWVDRAGPRKAVILGAILAACASLIPVVTLDFGALLLSRTVAGLGQGLLFIGMQAAVLAHAPAGQRTQAAAIIVFGFNGGMIAGAAIGSLLVQDVSAVGVFVIGAATALLLAAYAAWSIAVPPARSGTAMTFGRMLRDIPRAFVSLGFLRALLLIGAPAKAVLTGAVGFALPLLLGGLSWAPEDIGQIIMLYAAGVLLSGGAAARFVDRTQHSSATLALGGLASALALGCIGVTGLWTPSPVLHVILVAGGTLLLGLAHGCINAPVITYIAGTSAATTLGANGAMALYRVVERVGHVLGPLLAGQLLLLSGGGAQAFLWIGAGLLACLLLFLLPMPKGRS